jgi:spoIIIJ-associated protein
MPADERRIIHLTLAGHPDVATHSIGFGEARKVVIEPKEQ